MKLDVDFDPNCIEYISISFNCKEPSYTLCFSGIELPITRAQMLNIIDDVTEAKRNA